MNKCSKIFIFLFVFTLFLKSTYAQSETLTLCAGGEILATINQHAIITQSCLSKDYISDGRIWKPCDSYDVSFELEGSNYICTGTSTIKDRTTLSPKIRQWVECCPNGNCQSSTNGIRLLPGRNVTLALNDGECPLGEVERGVDDLGNVICELQGVSCKDIKRKNPEFESGVYFVDPDGPRGTLPFEVYCDMSGNGVTKSKDCPVLKDNVQGDIVFDGKQPNGDCIFRKDGSGSYSYQGNRGSTDDHEICQMILQDNYARVTGVVSYWCCNGYYAQECYCASNCDTKDVTWACASQNSNPESKYYCDLSGYDEIEPVQGVGGDGVGDFLVNGVHTSDDCINAGGEIVEAETGNNVCRFLGTGCPGSWTKYKSWSTGKSNTCSKESDVQCEPGRSCTAPSWSWSDREPTSCVYSWRRAGFGVCSLIYETCTGIVTSRGCY